MTKSLVGEGMLSKRIIVAASDALVVKALVDSYEGVANVFAERGGELTLAAPIDRARELDELLEAIEELIAKR